MLCSEKSIVQRSPKEITIAPLRCRCWHCDDCRPLRTQRLIHEARSGKPTIFITLTSRNRPGHSPHAAARALVTAWRRVRLEYIKAHGQGSLPFLAVFEATKKGWPHLHIVARCKWLDQRWLSRRMAGLIGSPVVDVRAIDGVRKIAAYVSKYIGKNPHRFKGVKRYWRSQDYLDHGIELDAAPGVFPPPWEIDRWPMHRIADWYEAQGHAVVRRRHRCVIQLTLPP